MLPISKLVTHGGIFHADDVFSTALFRVMGCQAPVVRVSEVPDEWKNDPSIVIYDIGFGQFDHHQSDSEVRKNGVPYAAFGLLVRHYQDVLFTSDAEYQYFDKCFVQPMDGSDNGFFAGENQLSRIIEAFNPAWDEYSDPDVCFSHAVSAAVVLLGQKLKQCAAVHRAEQVAKDHMPVDHVVYLDKYAPVELFYRHDDSALWLCFPSQRGGWMVTALHDKSGRDKALFPSEYRGKEGDQLPEGMSFCHKNGFCAVFDDLTFVKRFMSEKIECVPA